MSNSIVQQKELLMILNGLNELSVNDGNNDDLKKLSRLLIQLIPYSSRINNLDKVLPQVLIKNLTVTNETRQLEM